MKYYNIHTHHVSKEPDECCILNTNPSDFEENKQKYPGVYSCGVHPWYAEEGISRLKILENYVRDSSVVAIGEAGFDRLKGADLEIQQKVFEFQGDLSEQVHKPLIIHCVRSWAELMASKKRIAPKQAWIIHGYRGNPHLTQQLLDKGFYFSVGEQYNKESIKIIPYNRLFCETDILDISIKRIYNNISENLNLEIDKLLCVVASNVRDIFYLLS